MSLARRSATKVEYSVSGSLFLYRRASGIYFVRLCVPTRLKAAVGKGELHRSTGCREVRLAKIVAAEIVAYWHRSIESLKHMDINKLQAGSVKLLGEGYITLQEASEECGAEPADLAGRLVARGFGLYVRARDWVGWLTDDVHQDFDHVHDPVTGEVTEVVLDGTRLGGDAARRPYSGYVSIRFVDEIAELLRGEAQSASVCQFLFWPSQERALMCDLPGRRVELPDVMVRPSDVTSITRQLLAVLRPPAVTPSASDGPAPAPAPAHVSSFELFSRLCARYFDLNEALWTKGDHRRRKEDHAQMFIQLVGDMPINEIDRRVTRDFAEKIKDVPAGRSKFAIEFGLVKPGFKHLATLKKTHNRPGISEGEQRKVLDTLSQIFNWAVAEGVMLSNPATKLGAEAVRRSGRRKTKAHEQRLQLAPEDLNKVFSAPWFVNGVGARTAKGTFYAFRPHYFWLPLLALYCGGRLNELSQLYLKDVVVHESLDCLDFNLVGDDKIEVDEGDPADAEDKSLKNTSSARIVPIPHRLIELGFIAYVKRLRELGYTRLFPELKFDAEKGYGKHAGKWFNDAFLGKKLGIPRDGKKTFHSMRHNFATALGALNAEPNLKADLMGHMRKGSTAEVRYDKGAFANRKTLIDQVTHPLPRIHPFNVELGVQALKDAVALKASRAGKGLTRVER